MNVKMVMQSFLDYYNYTRGVGHTKAALNGVHSDVLASLVTRNSEFCNTSDTGLASNQQKPLTRVPDVLCGNRGPIVWDNAALIEVFSEAVNKIGELEEELEKAKPVI